MEAVAQLRQQAKPFSMVIPTSRYVLIEVASAKTGLTKKAIQRKIERGEWIEGKHFRRRDGRVFIDMVAYEAWVEQR
jgi:hypothetical protein